jgi:hypothetical protein
MRLIRNGAVALALMGGLAACSDDQASRDAVADEAKQTTSVAPARDCQAVAYDRNLAAGCWAIQARGLPASPLAELDLPAGFTGNDAWVWANADKEDEWGAITLVSVGPVYPDPCARAGNPSKVGPSVEDFARALAAQKVVTTTTPIPVSLDGHEGVYLEVSVPAGFRLSSCPGEELILWEAGEESPGLDASFVSRYWVLDVDGQRVVLVVNTKPHATDATVARFTRIAESATFAKG